eukprot:c55444_g1_i1.p1 GENE.c55444_g1_i1~~c55444_g1_i1.p1  ORF type:complete len:420 (+),score=65.85 c55444_g1_i1:1-1260(+)
MISYFQLATVICIALYIGMVVLMALSFARGPELAYANSRLQWAVGYTHWLFRGRRTAVNPWPEYERVLLSQRFVAGLLLSLVVFVIAIAGLVVLVQAVLVCLRESAPMLDVSLPGAAAAIARVTRAIEIGLGVFVATEILVVGLGLVQFVATHRGNVLRLRQSGPKALLALCNGRTFLPQVSHFYGYSAAMMAASVTATFGCWVFLMAIAIAAMFVDAVSSWLTTMAAMRFVYYAMHMTWRQVERWLFLAKSTVPQVEGTYARFGLEHPRAFSVYDYVASFVYLAMLSSTLPFTIAVTITAACMGIFRMDQPRMPSLLARMDWAYMSYLAMTISDAQSNNPIALCALEVLRLRAPRRGASIGATRARARWLVAYTLVRNPELISMRRGEAAGREYRREHIEAAAGVVGAGVGLGVGSAL